MVLEILVAPGPLNGLAERLPAMQFSTIHKYLYNNILYVFNFLIAYRNNVPIILY